MKTFALLLVLCTALYVPNLGRGELEDEEGRRAWVAREMAQSGDYVLPTIWGRPYLAKPPGLPWLIHGMALVRGRLDEFGVRLPSVFATFGTALALLLLGRRMGAAGAGLLAGVLWLISPASLAKGAFGELEALLTFTVTGALGLTWWSVQGDRPRRVASVGAGLLLGAALLTKGPPALLFQGAATVALLWVDPRLRGRRGLWLGLPWLIGLIVAGIWVASLWMQVDRDVLLSTWRGEMLDRGSPEIRTILRERVHLLAGMALGCLPASLLLACAVGTDELRNLRERPALRFLVVTLALSTLALLGLPGVRSRYALPVLPLAALVGGLLAAEVLQLESARGRARLHLVAGFCGLIGVVFSAGALLLFVRPISGLSVFGPLPLSAALGAGAVGLGLLVRGRRWSARHLLLGLVLVMALCRLAERTGILPQESERWGRAAAAQAIDAALEPGETLHVVAWTHFNELFYVEHPLLWVHDRQDVPPGAALLLRAAHVGPARAGLVVLHAAELEHGGIVIARRR